MSKPVTVPCSKGAWTLVASGVNQTKLWRSITNAEYLYTYRDAGDASLPTSVSDGVPIFRGNDSDFETLPFSVLSDIYIYCQVNDGAVRVDHGSGAGASSAKNLNAKVPADNFAIQQNGVATALTNPTVFNDKQITVDDPSTFSIGDVVVITNPQSIYFGDVLAVVGSVITLDSRLPFAYLAGDTVQSYTKDMNVDGSVTPQVFSIFGPGASGVKLNIVRLVWNSLTATAVDLSTFGDIAGGLTNGLLIRGVPNPASGLPASNQFNIKTNGDLDTLTGGDWKVAAATNPAQGQDGFTARYTYGGADKHDTIPPLETGDRLDIIVNDNLLSLLVFRTLFGGNTEFLT